MEKIKEIEKVNGFFIDQEEIIWSGDKLLLNSNIIIEGDIQLIRFKEGNLYVQKTGSSVLIESNSLSKYDLPSVGNLIQKEVLLYGEYNESYTKRKITAKNYKTQETLWEKENGIGEIYWENDHLFGHLNSLITKYSQENGNKVWETDLSVLGDYSINGELKTMDLQEFIGLYNGHIYVKAGTHLILGINILTGDINFKSEYKENFLVLDNLKIDRETNSIFSIGPKHYIEFNLSNCNYVLTNIEDQTIKFGVETTNIGGWETNNIYFWEGSVNNKFGQFSRKHKSINWTKSIDEVEDMFPSIKELKYGMGRLYVNDHNNKLHIYQIK